MNTRYLPIVMLLVSVLFFVACSSGPGTETDAGAAVPQVEQMPPGVVPTPAPGGVEQEVAVLHLLGSPNRITVTNLEVASKSLREAVGANLPAEAFAVLDPAALTERLGQTPDLDGRVSACLPEGEAPRESDHMPGPPGAPNCFDRSAVELGVALRVDYVVAGGMPAGRDSVRVRVAMYEMATGQRIDSFQASTFMLSDLGAPLDDGARGFLGTVMPEAVGADEAGSPEGTSTMLAGGDTDVGPRTKPPAHVPNVDALEPMQPSDRYYEHTQWIDFPDPSTVSSRRAMIRTELERLIELNRTTVGEQQAYPNLSQENTSYLHREWSKEVADLGDVYLDSLFFKEKNFREKHRRLSSLANQLEIATQDSTKSHAARKGYAGMLKAKRREKEELEGWRKLNKQNFGQRLGNLPLSACVIGRAEFDLGEGSVTGNPTYSDVEDPLADRVLGTAVAEVKGVKVSTVTAESEGRDEVMEFVVQESAGIAHVRDQYHSRCVIEIGETPSVYDQYLMALTRVDVYPFRPISSGEDENASPMNFSDGNIETFVLKRQDGALYAVPNHHRTQKIPVADLGLGSEFLPYLNYILDDQEEDNQLVQGKISEFYTDYDKDRRSLRNQLVNVDAEIANLEADSARVAANLLNADAAMKDLRIQIALVSQERDVLEGVYEQAYASREGRIARREEQDMKEGGWKNKLVESCYAGLNDLKKAYSSTQLEVLSGAGATDMRLSGRQVQYQMQVKSFKIIYLQVDPKSQTAFLNLGFEVVFFSKKAVEIDEDQRLFRQIAGGREWTLGPTAFSTWLERGGQKPAGAGWRLPTFDELRSLYRDMSRWQSQNDEDPFVVLDWGEPDYYVSQSRETAHDGSSLVATFDFELGEPLQIRYNDSAPVLWVRDYAPK